MLRLDLQETQELNWLSERACIQWAYCWLSIYWVGFNHLSSTKTVETVWVVIRAFWSLPWWKSCNTKLWEHVGERCHTPPCPLKLVCDGRHESLWISCGRDSRLMQGLCYQQTQTGSKAHVLSGFVDVFDVFFWIKFRFCSCRAFWVIS